MHELSAGLFIKLATELRTEPPAPLCTQLSQALDVIKHHLGSTLVAVHLYGSVLEGGLKRYSDVDLLVMVNAALDDKVRRALMLDLLTVSAAPGASEVLRALEITVVLHDDIVPWRYPARRELQFGEWLREDIVAGVFESAMVDPDLAILLTKARQRSVALIGAPFERLFASVPSEDFRSALSQTLTLWCSPADWAGDERNVLLTLARIWYSAATGRIAAKDVAADWVLPHLPDELQPVLSEARQAYLGDVEDRLALRGEQQLAALVQYMRQEAATAIGFDSPGSHR